VELLHALLQFDLIGFQTDDDRRNFVACLSAFLPFGPASEVADHSILRILDRETKTGVYPLGIDFDEFSWESANPGIIRASDAIRKYMGGTRIVLSVERLDFTAGIFERVIAFRRLLERYPDTRNKVTLIQVTTPCSDSAPDYKWSKFQLESIIHQINEEFGDGTYTPIWYYSKPLTYAQLVAFYRSADIAFMTPLKSGINIASREFCACKNDDRGVLILSEFAAASDELKRAALLVNPYDIDGAASTLHHSLTMHESEQKRRMSALRLYIRSNDVFSWSESFHADAATFGHSPSLRRMPSEGARNEIR